MWWDRGLQIKENMSFVEEALVQKRLRIERYWCLHLSKVPSDTNGLNLMWTSKLPCGERAQMVSVAVRCTRGKIQKFLREVAIKLFLNFLLLLTVVRLHGFSFKFPQTAPNVGQGTEVARETRRGSKSSGIDPNTWKMGRMEVLFQDFLRCLNECVVYDNNTWI